VAVVGRELRLASPAGGAAMGWGRGALPGAGLAMGAREGAAGGAATCWGGVFTRVDGVV